MMVEKKCESCGAPIDVNGTECKYCGMAVEARSNLNQSAQYQQQTNSTTYSSNYAYLKPYYQEQFQKMDADITYKGKWNWAAFFFGLFWGFSKGLWALALINVVVVLLFIDSNINFGLGFSLVWGFMGNNLYYHLKKNNKQFGQR